MKRILLSFGLFLALTGAAMAQCVGVGNINNAPPPGINCATEPVVATFVASAVGVVPAASATDIACLTGSASKVIRVQKVRVNGTAATSIAVPAILKKHTVANTGGTSAAITGTAMDSTNVAATGAAISYSANPTIDSTARNIAAGTVVLAKNDLSAGGPVESVFDFTGQRYSQAPVLRGTAQQVCVNLNATSPSTGAVNVSFEWTEAAQ